MTEAHIYGSWTMEHPIRPLGHLLCPPTSPNGLCQPNLYSTQSQGLTTEPSNGIAHLESNLQAGELRVS
jgi:hypothetical protein